MTWHFVYLSFEEGVEGRNYVGKHSTDNLNDGYLGSYSDSTFNPSARIILEYAHTVEAAITAEIRWQRALKVVENPQFVNRAYQTSTKFDTTGLRMPDDYKKERSLKYTGEGNPNFGKTTPKEVKEKISQTLTGRKASKEACEKLSNRMKGNQHRKGKPQPPEAVEKVRQQNLGRKNSAETKERQKQAALKRWSDHRAKKVQNG